MKLTVRKKITILLLLMLCAVIANIMVIFYYQRMREYDSHIVNIAGRQRMLSQKISKLALLVANGNEKERKSLKEALVTYNSSLHALRYGGEVMGAIIPPSPDTMKEKFKENNRIWEPFKKNIEIAITEKRNNPSFSEALLYIQTKNELLLKMSDDVVTAYEKLHDTNKYSHEINVAGRQRMLSQKITKHVISIAIGSIEYRNNLIEAVELYEKSLLTMRDGGTSVPWGKRVKAPPDSVKNTLDQLMKIWNIFKKKAALIHDTSRKNRKFIDAIDYIRLNNEKLLMVSDTITGMFDIHFSKKVARMRTILFGLLGIDIFIFLFGCYKAKEISTPIKDLSEIAAKIGAGDFSVKINIPNSSPSFLVINQ